MSKIVNGYINTVDKEKGTVTVYRVDQRCVTGEMPMFSHIGGYKALEVGDLVLVVYLDDGTPICLGNYIPENEAPNYEYHQDCGSGVEVYTEKGKLILKDVGGSISIAQILKTLKDHEERLGKLGG